MLPLELGTAAVRVARAAAEAEVLRARPRRGQVPPGLDVPRGAFVTLWTGAALRGCVGYGEPHGPLHAVLGDAARGAVRDPRFAPVRPRDLEGLTVEASILTPPAPLRAGRAEELPGLVRVGEHGLIVRRGRHRGLLLPQVALEHGMDAEAFLDAACAKAGLDPGAWRLDGLEWHAFRAQVFREAAPRGPVEEAGSGPRPELG
jgi:hypothetical protein